MSYKKTDWQNGITQLNAQNMNHIEDGIEANDAAIATTNQNLQTTNNNVAAIDAKIPKIILLDVEEET